MRYRKRLLQNTLDMIDKLSFSTKFIVYADKMCAPIVHHSMESVLNTLHNYGQTHDKNINELLSIYDKYCNKNCHIKRGKQYPIIVIEGLDATGKTTITTNLVKNMNAVLLISPPKCITHVRNVFDNSSLLRTAYYSLGNYIVASQIEIARKTKPVIVDRYWHSTAAYALAQAVKTEIMEVLPPAGDKLYQWPVDLLKPDAVLYLSVSEAERLRRHALRNTTNTNQEQELKNNDSFRADVCKAYRNMINPDIQVVDADCGVHEIVNDIIQRTQYLFS